MMPMLMAFFVLLSPRPRAGMLAFAVVAAWFGGYAETWIAKWLLAYFALPASVNVIADVFTSVELRTVGALNGVYLFPLAATFRVFFRALDRGGIFIVLILALAIAQYAFTVSRINWRRAFWLWSPVLVSAAWFEALTSHSQWHLTQSSRSAAMALAIMLSGLVIAMLRRPTLTELYDQLGILWDKRPFGRHRR
jgi:hypothetical protein